MGWSNCGVDSLGRQIGYAHEATCDEPDCDAKIDRGLSYACGGMHGGGDGFCDWYFCWEHLYPAPDPAVIHPVCRACHDLCSEGEG